MQHICTSVVQTRIEAKRRESFDNHVFFDIEAKRTLSIALKNFPKRANMFILKNLIIEAKRSNLILNCESSEAKRTCSIVKKTISKRSEHVYIEEFKYRSQANTFVSSKNLFRSEANMIICKNLNIEAKRSKLMLNRESSEAKRTCSIVEKKFSKRSEHVYIEEF